MFKVKSTKAEKFDEVMYKAVFTTVRDALERILKMEYKTDDGKYYELPFYEAYPTIAYDIELFETRNYYFAKGGAPSEFCEFTQSNNTDKATGEFSGYKYVGAIGARSAGPDGKYGTNDDGLPATYDKFLRCARKYRGIT